MEPIEPTRRQLLAALPVAGLSAVTLGLGTDAASSDSEAGLAAISTGTLDLKIDGGDSVVTVLSLSGIRPGESGSGTVDLENTGNLSGELVVTVDVTEDTERRRGGSDSDGGELDTAVELQGDFAGSTVWSYATPGKLDDGSQYTLNGSFGPGAGTFTLSWQLPYSVGLESPLDEVTVQLTFELE